jgi:hypothetical protein
MAHQFDTGLGTPQRTLVRRGAVATLSPLKRSNGGYLSDVRPFGGIVRTYTDDDGIEFLMKAFTRTPCIGVQLGTQEFETLAIGGRQALSDCELMLYVATQHGRDELLGRQESDVTAGVDPSADPGLDVMLEHCIELMHGTYPTLLTGTVKQIQIKRQQELVTSPEITIWLQTYRVKLQSYARAREWRTAPQLLADLANRVTTETTEVGRPNPATEPTTIDFDVQP